VWMEFGALNQFGVVAEQRFEIERRGHGEIERERERERGRNDKVCEVNGCFFCVKYM